MLSVKKLTLCIILVSFHFLQPGDIFSSTVMVKFALLWISLWMGGKLSSVICFVYMYCEGNTDFICKQSWTICLFFSSYIFKTKVQLWLTILHKFIMSTIPYHFKYHCAWYVLSDLSFLQKSRLQLACLVEAQFGPRIGACVLPAGDNLLENFLRV